MENIYDNKFGVSVIGLSDISIHSLTGEVLELTEDEALNLATWLIMMLGYYKFKSFHSEFLKQIMGR